MSLQNKLLCPLGPLQNLPPGKVLKQVRVAVGFVSHSHNLPALPKTEIQFSVAAEVNEDDEEEAMNIMAVLIANLAGLFEDVPGFAAVCAERDKYTVQYGEDYRVRLVH